jgi:hypothetical protein
VVAATSRRLLLLAVVAFAACRHESKPRAKQPLIGWRPFESWSGRGNVQTDSFDMMSGEWRIKWKTTNETAPGAGTFRVTVHSAVSGRPLLVAVDHRGIGHDVAYVNDDPRLYHLVIESSNVDWSIAIEEAVVAEAP